MALSLQRYMQPDIDIDSKLIRLLKDRSKKERERSMLIAIADVDCLNEGLIVEILSWLPVKWLLQYKSVCKAWHAIISSPDFVSKHLKNYYRNKNDSYMRDFFIAQYLLDPYCLQSLVMVVDETPTPRVLACEDMVDMPMYVSQICGPCDGLYYLYYYHHCRRALWNPAINELRELPPLINKPHPLKHFPPTEVFGLGFDPASTDYKVVVIAEYMNTVTDCREPQSVVVYSLRNDCWRYCGDLHQNYDLDKSKSYNYINGWYYWMKSNYPYDPSLMSDAIIGFNLATDEFEEIKLPDYKKPASKGIGIYDDSLALLSFDCEAKFFEIWTLTEGIWAMKLRVGPFLELWTPIGHWKDNKLFLESEYEHEFDYEYGHLAFFDPKSQHIKELSYRNTRSCRGVFVCGESLVSIKRDSSPIETSESDSELGTRGLFSCETRESDSDYGIHSLFSPEASESDSEFGIQDLFYYEG